MGGYTKLQLQTYFLIESNAIEGIRIPLLDIRHGLQKGIYYGHVGALLFAEKAVKERAFFCPNILFTMHRLTVGEQNDHRLASRYVPHNEQGVWRKCPIYVGRKQCLHHKKIPKRMKALFKKIYVLQKEGLNLLENREIHTVLERMADIHFEYLQIHPFTDGNGRTSRLIAWYLFRYLRLRPFIFTAEDRWETYYPACKEKKLMREYFLSRHQS